MTKKLTKKPVLTKEQKETNAMVRKIEAQRKRDQKEMEAFQKKVKSFESDLTALGKKHKVKLLTAVVDEKTGNPFGSQVGLNGMLEQRGMSAIMTEMFS